MTRPTNPMVRVAVRGWLHVKFMREDTRHELAQQAMIWLGLTVFFVWGVVGLVAAPFQ